MITLRDFPAAALARGVATYIPGMYRLFAKHRPHTRNAALYCYGVWLKHLTLLWDCGPKVVPRSVAELGPGANIGVGLSALLSGACRYAALDVVQQTNLEANLDILDQLIDLFSQRTPRPKAGWPPFDELLPQSLFPSHILTEDVLADSLSPSRIANIRRALCGEPSGDICIEYIVPNEHQGKLAPESVDMFLSHCVFEYVPDLDAAYGAIAAALKVNGVMSHHIDLSAHEFSRKWNGHWTYPRLVWKALAGNRPFALNREPSSAHESSVLRNGFKILREERLIDDTGFGRGRLQNRWQHLSDEDLRTATLFVQAQKTQPR